MTAPNGPVEAFDAVAFESAICSNIMVVVIVAALIPSLYRCCVGIGRCIVACSSCALLLESCGRVQKRPKNTLSLVLSEVIGP